MKQRLFCRDKVRKLLHALLEEPDTKRIATSVEQESFPPRMSLSYVLGERLSAMYYATLNVLMRELVPQYVSQSDLAQAFWKLFGKIAANPAGYHIRGRLTKRLDKFVEEWERPLKLYEVAYRISNLNLGRGFFSFGHVRFFTMNATELSQWGISKENPLLSHEYDDFAGQPVATIQVKAADNARAFETGLREVLFGLDLLRLAGVRDLIPRLDDEMFLWKLEGRWMARQINPPQPCPSWGWYRTFRPLIVDMAGHIRKGLEPENSNLLAIANGELPEEITSHLERAISWISSSVTREQFDSKVVDLCTALEIMLLPGYEGGRKGQIIDLRHRLIGGDWVSGGILQLYELRSKIVHGSALNVSRYLDYWYLLHMCFEALKLLVNHAKRNPQMQTLEDLIKTVETKEKLEDFVHKIGVFEGKRARQVKQAAKRCLNDLRRS